MNAIESAIRDALEAADAGPDEFRSTTYSEVLRFKLSQLVGLVDTSSGAADLRASQRREREPQGGAPESYMLADHGTKEMHVVWAVIEITEEEAIADNKAIRQRIQEVLGVTPQNRQNTNRTLRDLVPRYLRRSVKEQGRGYQYLPGPRALEIFADLGADGSE